MISAIVLAAGRSTRMGRPKPIVRIGERPLLAHTLSSLRRSRAGQVVVVLGYEAELVRREVPLVGTTVVLNPDYETGMSTSIQTGIRAADPSADGFLIVLADQPFVSSTTIDSLLDRWTPTGPKILIPTYHGVRGNPVLLDQSLSSEVQTLSGDIGCRAIFDDHPDETVEVPVEDPGILFDLDTPELLEALQKELQKGRPLDTAVADLVSAEHSRHLSGMDRRKHSPIRARRDVLALAADFESRHETFALATVVRVTRPTSGKPGNRAIVRANRELVGWVGGSCTDSAVLAEGLAAIRDGRPRLLRLSKEPNLAQPAEGVVEYYMECHSGGSMEIYIEPHVSKPRLLIVGDSPIAETLAALGRLMDYQVVLTAPKATAEAFPEADEVVKDIGRIPELVVRDTYAVVATMGKYDGIALRALASSRAAYVGLVASRKRAAAVVEDLRREGISDSALARIRNPAGLDLAARTPEEIALSIMAEITRIRRTETPKEIPVVAESPGVGKAKMVIDVVCGMEVDPSTPVKAIHQGTNYAFCSEMCRSRFLESPQSFL